MSPMGKTHPSWGGTATFGFGDAVKYMKRGLKVKRQGWNGKNQYIELATSISYTKCRWRDCEAARMMPSEIKP
ncbi:MAG: MW1434 family type I TA system toxin [Enterocloster sp.]